MNKNVGGGYKWYNKGEGYTNGYNNGYNNGYKGYTKGYPKKYTNNTLGLWIVMFVLGILVLWILNSYIKDKKDVLTEFFKKDREPVLKIATESKGETICRRSIEKIFNKKFIKIRPNFLRNNVTNFNLELDIFNEELMLAIEYNGRQHYHFTPFFHKNKETFTNQRYRDEIKRMICKNMGIKLIEIPYTVKHEDLYSHIYLAVINLGYKSGI